MINSSSIHRKRLLVLLFLYSIIISLVVSGCASDKLPRGSKPTFKTRISSSGLKHFEFRLVTARTMPDQIMVDPGKRRTHRGGGAPMSSNDSDRMGRILEKHLAQQMEITGFCHQGYWILKTETYDRSPYIRGECNDLATDSDRTDFPDTLLRW